MSKRPSRGVTSGVGTPTKMTGRDGDLTIRKTREGKILYVKEHGSWHPINTGVDTVKLKKDVDSLIRSVNSIRSDNSPFLTIDTLNIRRDKIKLGTDGTGLTLKNNSGALNIRNEADSADVQLAVGYGGTGLSTFTGADRIIKSTGATTLAATQTLPSTVQGNITSVGTISSGTWQGNAIATTYTAAKVTEVDGNTGAVTASEIKATALTDATAGTLTASKAIIVDSNKAISNMVVSRTYPGAFGPGTYNLISGTAIVDSTSAGSRTVNGIAINLDKTSGNTTGYTMNVMDLQVDGSSKLKVNDTGAMTSTGTAANGDGSSGDNRYLHITTDGLIGYRTAAQIKGDIGGTAASSTFTDITIDKDSDATTTTTNYAQQIDLDHTGNTASGQTVTNYGLDIDLDVTGNNQGYASNVNSFGINIAMNADAGTHSAYSGIDNTAIKAVLTGDTTTGSTLQVGYDLTITGGDTGSQTGILINTDNGSTDLKIVSSANTSDYATISTGANGATTIETVDDGGGESADLTLNIDGSLYIDADGGDARLNDGGGTYTPAHADSLTTKSYVDTKSKNTIIIGGLMPRNMGSAGYHRAVPTVYDITDLTLGNSTDPATSLTVSTNGDHANNRLIAFPDDIIVTKCKVSISEGGSTNTTHNIHLMRYDIDADGDWSNGTVVGTGTNSNSDDYSQGRFIALSLSGTASDLQVAESNQALVLCVESVDGVNLYQSVKAYLKYEWA